jgi:DNA-binding GntR family transcriptional regulator
MKNMGELHENLDQKVYLTLKQMITDRHLLPGQKIAQVKLAEELGISRTPLVNALKYLEKEKLIESRPRRGFYVRLFTREEMVSIFELREVLEGLAARRVAEHITDKEILKLRRFFKAFKNLSSITDIRAYAREDRGFHFYVSELGSKEFLKSVLQSFNIISFSYQFSSSEGLVRAPQETIIEHLSIIEAISDRDPVAAEQMMRRHFQRAIANIRSGMA